MAGLLDFALMARGLLNPVTLAASPYTPLQKGLLGDTGAGATEGGRVYQGGSNSMFTRAQLEKMDTEKLDRMAFGHGEGDTLSLNPGQIALKYPGDLENPQDKFSRGGLNWAKSVDLSEPVNISIGRDGKFYLEDGHHRWFAASKLDAPLRATISKIDANSISEILRKQGTPE